MHSDIVGYKGWIINKGSLLHIQMLQVTTYKHLKCYTIMFRLDQFLMSSKPDMTLKMTWQQKIQIQTVKAQFKK